MYKNHEVPGCSCCSPVRLDRVQVPTTFERRPDGRCAWPGCTECLCTLPPGATLCRAHIVKSHLIVRLRAPVVQPVSARVAVGVIARR